MRTTFCFLCLFFISFQSFALVDMNSAAYSNSWIDLELAGDAYDLKVVRAYKSRTLFNGIFGFGWCSEFETALKITSESSVTINECGDGLETEYSVLKNNAESPEETTGGTKKSNKEISVGLKMTAVENENEFVIREKNYFTRTKIDGSSQRFDLSGRLTHTYNKTGQFIKFNYSEGRLVEIVDEDNRKLNIKYGANSKVSKITGPNGISSEYRYDENDNLIWNKNAWAKSDKDAYTYEYNVYHNLTRAVWPDGTDIKIQYDNKKDWVTSFTDRDGCVEKYAYGASKKNPDLHYWSDVTKTCNGTVANESRFEFVHKKNIYGKVVLQTAITKKNDFSRQINYDINLEKPIKIINDGVTSTYSYYKDGLIKSKKMQNNLEEFSYDPTVKKISEHKISELTKNGKLKVIEFTKFRYDKKGNVNYLENSSGDKISVTYDLEGRIKTITDQITSEYIELKYEDKFGKPSVVTKQGLGSIQISYDKFGAISKVDSSQNPQVAVKIAGAFNKLIGLLAPVSKNVYE